MDLYERIARAPGKERELVDALMRRWSQGVAGSAPAREAIQLAQSLPDLALAETLLRRFLEDPTDDPAVRAWALCELAGYVAAAGDMSEAVLLKKEAAEISEPEAARKLLFEVAQLAMEKLGDMHLATSTYEELHEREPADRDAWQPLLVAYRQMSEPEKLANLIGEVQEYVDDDSERMRLRFERVKLRMERMGLGDEALPELQEIVNDDPTLVEAAILLSGIYERQGREEELAELLQRQLETAKDRSDAPSIASLSRRLGSILEKKDRDAAKAIYYTALDWEPAHVDILRALSGVHAIGGAEEAGDRADILERLLPLIPADEVEPLALDLSVLRADLGDVEGALRALEFGFKIAPKSRTIRDRLEKLYEESANHQKLAELYTLDADARTDVGEKVDLLLRAAKLYRDELADPELGASVLRRARDAEIKAVAERGGVIAGSSAGAMIQGSFLVNITKTPSDLRLSRSGMYLDMARTKGFGLLQGMTVYPHFFARHAEKDLLEVIARYPEIVGIGIDENTAIILHGNEFEVIGEGKVGFFEGKDVAKNKFLKLSKGQRFDLKKRTVIQ